MSLVSTILNNAWEVKKIIGKGSFSSIYVAKCIPKQSGSSKYVAIKQQNAGFDASVIRWESEVLKNLSSKVSESDILPVPRFIYSCPDYVVMELMSGEDMSALRNRVRNVSINGLIPIPVVAYLCKSILRAVQFMHSKGYVHRDVKPSNFVRRNAKDTKFCIIDFGITKQYLDKDSKIRPEKKEKSDFRGTTQYASPFVHIFGADQCPRDDLFSLFYVMTDMLCGQLPWTAATKAKDKPAVIELKREYFEDPSKMIAWIASSVNAANEKITRPDLNLTQEMQEGILSYYNHLKGLGYYDVPNYDLIADIFNRLEQPDVHNVGGLDFTYYGFNWTDGVDKLQFLSASSSASSSNLASAPSVDLSDPQAVIRSKLQPLLSPVIKSAEDKDREKALMLSAVGEGNGDGSGILPLHLQLTVLPRTDWKAAELFRDLLRELLELPERKISRETVEVFRKVLVQQSSFFAVSREKKEAPSSDAAEDMELDEWAEFVDVQNLIGGFYDLYGRVYKRPRELVTMSSLLGNELSMDDFLQEEKQSKRRNL